MFTETKHKLAAGVLAGVSTVAAVKNAEAALVTPQDPDVVTVDNKAVKESDTPLSLRGNIVVISLTNPRGQESDYELTIPMAAFNSLGGVLPSSESAGEFYVRLGSNTSRMNWNDITTTAPAAGEKDIRLTIPGFEQNNTIFGINYGEARVTLRGVNAQPGQTLLAGLQFVPFNGAEAAGFFGNGLDGITGQLISGVTPAILTNVEGTYNLANSDEFGENRVFEYKSVATQVPEAGAAVISLVGVTFGGLLRRERRPQAKKA